MPKLWIDNKPIEVPPGTTVLEAATRVGIAIPTLCHLNGCESGTSCMVCVVAMEDSGRLVPSCAMAAQDGMRIQSQTSAVLAARRSAVQLLLGDHAGDCVGPCQLVCPAHLDVPAMLRAIVAGDWPKAARTAQARAAGACPGACEKACRRGQLDAPVAICQLCQFVAGMEIASPAAPIAGGPASTASPTGQPFSHRLGKARPEELSQLLRQPGVSAAGRTTAGILDIASARAEAARCLHCDCRKADHCRLRDCATELGLATSSRTSGQPPLTVDTSHPHLIFESGKCIRCGLCVQIARREGEPLGLTLQGRGFDVRVAPPMGATLTSALQKAWQACAQACPTGALTIRG